MPATKVIKPKAAEAAGKPQVRPGAARGELRLPAARTSRAASCPRSAQRERCHRPACGAQGSSSKPGCERRARSTSAAPKPPGNWPKEPDCRRATTKPAAVEQEEQRSVRAEAKHATSHR